MRGLRIILKLVEVFMFQSLFWWMFSERHLLFHVEYVLLCFNPCFGGCSVRGIIVHLVDTRISRFNPCFGGCSVRGIILKRMDYMYGCFNPCFGGCSVRGFQAKEGVLHNIYVSILVLVDVQ